MERPVVIDMSLQADVNKLQVLLSSKNRLAARDMSLLAHMSVLLMLLMLILEARIDMRLEDVWDREVAASMLRLPSLSFSLDSSLQE
jgi:hypothetical protein